MDASAHTLGATVLFWVLALWVLAFGLGTVLQRSLFKAALSLAFCLFGVAGIFLMLGAEFLAGVQVLIYVGAVVTLVIFAVMLTQGMGDPAFVQFNRQRLPGAIVAGLTLLVLALVLVHGAFVGGPLLTQSHTVLGLGRELLLQYVLAFDLVTVLLLIAMVGAILLARKE